MILRSNWRLPVCAVLSYTLNFPCYAELTIAPGVLLEIDNLSSLENYDWIDNQGEILNNGVIDNYYNSQFINSGSVLNNNALFFNIGSELDNFGEFTNAGTVILSGAHLNNYGNFHNNGGTIDLSMAASVLNTGTFDNDGQVYGGPDEVFNNNGVLNNNQQLLVNLNNTGTVNNNADMASSQYLINQASAVLNNYINGVIETAKLENYGEINNQGSILLHDNIDASATGEINNSGVFNHSGVIDSYGSREISLVNSGEFTNSGTINPISGIRIQNFGIFNNNSTIIMNWYGERNSTVVNVGTFNNNAALLGSSYLENSGSFENNAAVDVSGDLLNRAGGIFNNSAGSFLNMHGVLDNQGEFNNYSELTTEGFYDPATGMVLPAQLNNSGVFNHHGSIVFLDYQASGLTVSNTGEFNNYGIFDGNESLTINNSGIFNNNVSIVRNSAYPSVQDRIDNSGTFTNDGGLQNIEIVVNSGVFTNNMGVVDVSYLDNSGVFDNNSTVNSIGGLTNRSSGVFNNIIGWMVEVMGVLDNRGEFNNQSTIMIHEYYDPATGMNTPAQLNNSGVFNHSGQIDVQGVQGLALNNSGEFNYHGAINGRFVINNSGTFNQYSNIDGFTTGYGEIINSGQFYSHNGLQVIGLNNSGIFENNTHFETYDSLSNSANGVFNNNRWASAIVSGVLNNQGEFNNMGVIDLNYGYDPLNRVELPAEINNSGIFNNGEAAVITAGAELLINNSGELNNFGEIRVSQKLTINNSGIFNYGSDNYGQFLNLASQSAINNYGTFNNFAYIDARNNFGTQLLNTGVLNNNASISRFRRFTNSGIVDNMGEIAVDYGENMVNLAGGVINNGYMLDPDAFIRISGALDNRGSINNASLILIGLGSVISNSGSIVNNGEISGPADINNTGSIINNGNMSRMGNITSSGQFTNDGQLQAENIQVTGGVFEGNGSVDVLSGMVVTEAGTLAPGNSTGWMDIYGDLELGGTLQMEFDWTSRPEYDQLHVMGSVILGAESVLDISVLSDDYFSLGQSFDLLFANEISGDFGGFYYDPLWDTSLALQWGIISDYDQDILRLSVVSAVPLPAAVWLFLSGVLGLTAIARRKRTFH